MEQSMRLLTLNTGSSSLKAALYIFEPVVTLELTVQIERIGHADSQLRLTRCVGRNSA
ncbi:MAG: hypothetical protein H0X37_12610 [Herpetosiphonaceae bacterium]|nr:hypothetical protein [Herpetosiphonaceae bacterium]